MSAEFDKFAKEYHKTLSKTISISGEKSQFFVKYRAQKFNEWIKRYMKSSPQTILDFGCGDGFMTREIQNYFPLSTVYGVDPSAESIKIAQKHSPNIHFSVSGNNLKQFKSNTFDAYYAAGAFHHIPFNEHDAYVQELNRILKPKGVAIIYELNPLNPGTQYIFRNSPIDQNATMLYPNYAKKLFSKYGTTSIHYYGFFPNFLSKLRTIEPYIERLPIGALYAAIITKD